jgi:hypothetical protein
MLFSLLPGILAEESPAYPLDWHREERFRRPPGTAA